MKSAVYPGTFDPITYGHFDIIQRGAQIFDGLTIAVAHNLDKQPMFTPVERVAMIRELTRDLPHVRVDSFEGMTVDYVRQVGTNVILRGMRTMSDFENEFQMALSNQRFAPEIETVFLMTSVEHSYLSSHRIREIALLGGDLSPFVPPIVCEKIKEKLADTP